MKQTNNTALLVMDMQTAIVDMLPESEELIKQVGGAIAFAREQEIPVFFIRVGFREGAPEISPNNKGFSASKEYLSTNSEQWQAFHPQVSPGPGDIIITKRRVSAFTGSDLEVLLRGFEIKHIVLTGIATSGVVLSTLREAADKDYKITVISDGCADRDEEVHRVLMAKVFPGQAAVLTLEQWQSMVL